MKKILFVLFITLFGYNCATVPITGRRQLSLISNSELLPMSFDNYKVVDEIPGKVDEIIYGLDFGYNNPSALVNSPGLPPVGHWYPYNLKIESVV